jgi:F-type H+-transporting ATPase subunit b
MEIKLYQLLFQMINFGVLLFVFFKFLYKPILKVLDQRSQRIDEGLLAAQKNLEEKEKLEAFKKAELLKAEKQAQKIIDDTKAEAQVLAQKLLEEAKIQAQASIKKDEAAFRAKMADEERRLSARLSDLVVITTKSLLKDSLTLEHQQSILDSQIRKLPKVQIN